MKISKKVLFDTKARRKLLKGVNILANAVGSTLGPKGRNVAVNQAYGPPTVWHDGVSVAKSINLKDQFQDMGAEILKEAAIKTNDKAGDGTTTATIIGQALINEGFKAIEAGMNPMTIKHEIDEAKGFCLASLEKLVKKVGTDDEVVQIATIASADENIGKLVAEAIKKVGKDGVTTVEEGKGFETTIEYKQGMEIDRGYLSPYFVTNQERVEATLENPYILITDKKINHNYEIVPFVEKFLQTDRTLVIIAGEVYDEAMATLVVNKMKGVINVLAVQAPAFGGRRVDELEDIAILTGGHAILQDSGRDLKSVEIEELGRAEKITSDRDKTVIINGGGDKKAIEKRMEELRRQMEIANTDFDKEIKRQRLAKLAGGVAVINVGANTEVELRERKERVIDAINATKAAIEEGVIAGGEIALLQVSQEGFWGKNPTTGAKILQEAIKRPFRCLVENAGFDYAEIWGKMTTVKYPFGIDVQDGEFKDLIKAGILDPVKVTRSALVNAVSAATMLLTTACLIIDDIS